MLRPYFTMIITQPSMWGWVRSAEYFWRTLSSSGRVGLSCLSVGAIVAFFTTKGSPGSIARKSMRILLFYRGWMYRDSGQLGGPKTSSKMQLRKRAYLASLRVLWQAIEAERWLLGRGKRGLLYAVQDTLPQLPLPRLRDTCERFLISIRPFLRPGARPLQSSRVRGCRPNFCQIDARFSCVWQRNMTTLHSTFRTWRRVVEQERHCRSPAMRGQQELEQFL